ncbi:MAG: hypothetical protein AABP62_24255 [Planctomycetota bacterium]
MKAGAAILALCKPLQPLQPMATAILVLRSSTSFNAAGAAELIRSVEKWLGLERLRDDPESWVGTDWTIHDSQ